MPSIERKLSLIALLASLIVLVAAPACKGFFVNAPTSVTVTPSNPTLLPGQTQSFAAQAAFSDNTTKNVTASATWSTSDPCIMAIITSGVNAGNATDVGTGGSATITASYNGVSGTATPTTPTGLTINPCPEKVVGNFPQVFYSVGTLNVTFTAVGASGGVTWVSDTPGVVNFASAGNGAVTFPGAGTAKITATAGTETASLFITVQ